MEILSDERKVLALLIHAESMDTIIRETGLQAKVALDIVRNLVHYGYVKLTDTEGKPVSMFSPDKLKAVRFMLSAKGFDVLEE
ncbi:MAG: hypothetical protein JNL57_10350 [Bacteroidetes bacterium]|nr:hypothetical protein [Bacteroidota bacterium]